jgi:hypothetical protein
MEKQIIDLGAASVETKGGAGQVTDEILLRPFAGLSDD